MRMAVGFAFVVLAVRFAVSVSADQVCENADVCHQKASNANAKSLGLIQRASEVARLVSETPTTPTTPATATGSLQRRRPLWAWADTPRLALKPADDKVLYQMSYAALRAVDTTEKSETKALIDQFCALNWQVIHNSVMAGRWMIAYEDTTETLVVSFRGTRASLNDIGANANTRCDVPSRKYWKRMPPFAHYGCLMHRGWIDRHDHYLKNGLGQAWSTAINEHCPKRLLVTGHSLGGAVAKAFAYWFWRNRDDTSVQNEGYAPPKTIHLVNFGNPALGTKLWKNAYSAPLDNGEIVYTRFQTKVHTQSDDNLWGYDLVPELTVAFANYEHVIGPTLISSTYAVNPIYSHNMHNGYHQGLKREFDIADTVMEPKLPKDKIIGGHDYCKEAKQ